jgi:two-component system chemotaxis response regulator CheB
VIDDSAVVRKHLADLLAAGGIDVIATAQDPLFAWDKMRARWPDVIVLDVEMPRMDGISFLRKLMAERPTPVVMCSTLTAAGARTTLQALAEGAVSFVTKPTWACGTSWATRPTAWWRRRTAARARSACNGRRRRRPQPWKPQPAARRPWRCPHCLHRPGSRTPAGTPQP